METKIEWNKVTWYSKLLAVVLFVLTFYIGFRLGVEKNNIVNTEIDKPLEIVEKSAKISITEKEITEDNFTGKVAVIAGNGTLVNNATTYIDKTLRDFKEQADEQVPKLREDFGTDSPTSNYSIDIGAKYLENSSTNSFIISVYTYTGGAHGSSYYKVFTLSKINQKIISINDVIKDEKESAFVDLIKKELINWRPEGGNMSPVFPDVVKDLTLNDFSEWSMDENNFIIYFSQYAIGPGAMGQVAFPVSIPKIKDMLISQI